MVNACSQYLTIFSKYLLLSSQVKSYTFHHKDSTYNMKPFVYTRGLDQWASTSVAGGVSGLTFL